MNIWEAVVIGFDQIRIHKMRAILSILGILISVGSVTGVISMGDGLRLTVAGEFEKSGGASNVSVQAPDSHVERSRGVWVRRDYEAYLDNKDVERILREVDHVKYVVPVMNFNLDVRYKQATAYAKCNASNEYFHLTRNWDVDKGRFINEFDVRNAAKVVVIGKQLAEDLYGDMDPVGQEMKIAGKRVRVVGVLKQRSFFEDVNERTLVMPYTTAQRRETGDDRVHVISVYAESPEYANTVAEQVRLILKRTKDHGEDYRVQTGEDQIGQFNRVVTILKMFAGGIAGISLLVGGIGIMNIMLVSVNERTREIGVRKALGAKRRNILVQFILEAMVLCLFGGALGILMGLGLGAGLSAWVKSMTNMPFESIVTTKLMVFAISYSACIGLFFGVYPAWRASKLDPIEALRYE